MGEDRRLDEVIRIQKRASSFVMLDKGFLEDDRLSFKAKGILAYLLSKPDNWKVIVKNLVHASAEGKAAVYAGLKELKECGYYEKKPVRNEQGTKIVRWESTVYEVPKEPECPNPSKEAELPEELHSAEEQIQNQQPTEPCSEEAPKPVEDSVAKPCGKHPQTRINPLLPENREIEKKTPEEEPDCLLPDFLEIENQEIENRKVDKRLNNNINNNYIKHHYISTTLSQSVMSCPEERQSQTKEKRESIKDTTRDRTEGWRGDRRRDREKSVMLTVLEETKEAVRRQIGYGHLKETHSREDLRLIDELVMIILDVLLSEGESIYLDGEQKPRELLRESLRKLKEGDIVRIVRQFRAHGGSVRKKHRYLLAMLYHAPMEREESVPACSCTQKQPQDAENQDKKPVKERWANRFCNFEGRQYDYDELERQLLEHG